jgi:uncharacterized protein (TIGR02271 family)
MSNIYSDNAPAVGSTRSENNLSALFDSRSDAEKAIQKLEDAGIPSKSIRFVPGYESDSEKSSVASDDRGGFWNTLENFFFPDEDRATYAEGLRRGGFLVSVAGLNEGDYQTAHDILDDDGSIDIDERADSWRAEGWNSTSTASASTYDRNASTIGTAGSGAAPAQGALTKDDETIQVVEENLRVGKRDVNNGSVKVRAYTVETPVSEQLSLRDENVIIDRKSVDRPLADTDRAFQDRTISAEEHHEEAIVSKDARVVEEIGIRKTAADRTETISDTVRKTEVEVEDGRTAQGEAGQSGIRRG